MVYFVLQIREACQDMVLSDEQLKEIMDRLLKNINEGLSKESHDNAAVKCFVTYVQDLPNGKGKLESDDMDSLRNNHWTSHTSICCHECRYSLAII